MRTLAALLSTAMLAGCATDQPMAFQCPRINEFRIEVDVTPAGPVGLADGKSLEAVLQKAVSTMRTFNRGSGGDDILVLSGGGKWGAYGAGLLRAWSARTKAGEARPMFSVVTGVSTGAMQSTFAFLGPSADSELVGAYTIDKESQLVKRYGSLFFLNHGSTADLSPLRSYALKRVVPLLDQVAKEDAKGRKLLVGSVDAMNGKMYAIDMTRIASKLEGRERQECYVGALLASAAIPVIFRQVTIEGRPYYDAGVRHSVFLTSMQQAAAKAFAGANTGSLYVLMNGVPGVAETPTPIPAKIIPTLLRLQAITFDQVEQNSVYAVSQEANAAKTFVATAKGHGCKIDNDNEDIFNPAFMKCLIAAGGHAWDGGSPWKPYPSKP